MFQTMPEARKDLNIPEAWLNMLVRIQLDDRDAIIAGGCIRDLYLGRVPKDVDIFTTAVPEWIEPQPSDMNYEGMKYVEAVVMHKCGPDTFNVIVTKPVDKMDLLRSFDFGICQIGFDGRQVYMTQEFLWDVKYSKFTLRHIDRYQRSINRYSRISARYAGWEIAIPELDNANALKPSEAF